MAKHISVFMENKPGKLEKITKVLAENSINLRAISVASSGKYGITKMLVNNPVKAEAKLSEQDITVSLRDVLAIIVTDTPGGLYSLIKLFSENSINIEDCYGFVMETKQKAVIVVEVHDLPAAEKVLSENQVEFLSDSEIYNF